MMEREKESIFQCWADTVGVISLACIILLHFSRGYKRIIYIRITKGAEIVIRICGINRMFDFRHVSRIEPEMSACDERELYHRAYREKSKAAIDFGNQYLKNDWLARIISGIFNKSKIDLFLKQEIAKDIEDFFILSNFMRWEKENLNNQKDLRDVLIIKSSPWKKHLSGYGHRLFYLVLGYPDIKRTASGLFIPFKVAIEITANLIFMFLPGKNIPAAKGNKPKIAVLHAQGADLSKRSDYFWFPASGIDPSKILVYFRYDCWPPAKETINFIESYGMKWVNLLPWKMPRVGSTSTSPEFYKLPHILFVKNQILCLYRMTKSFFYCLFKVSRISFWQWHILSDLANRTAVYESFFKIYGIKVHYGLYETGIDMTASNIAIERSGGIDACHHWSNYDHTEISIGKPYDIYFVWGSYYKNNFFNKDFYNVNYFVYTGYPYDNFFSNCKDSSHPYRRQLIENGAQFIVTFFDQSYSDDWPKANKAIADVYKALLNKAINDSRFGLITKPKKNGEFWSQPALKEFELLAKKALKTGRCILLNKDTFPNEAAQAADLVVGFGVYSTPAIEAALSGVPAITIDLQNLSSHPFYKRNLNSYVFNDLEKAMGKIKEYLNAGKAPLIIPEDVDPFRDGRSSERIGFFIKNLIDGFDKKLNRNEAVNHAVNSYREKWGKDKVAGLDGEPAAFKECKGDGDAFVGSYTSAQ
ncbi:MAG: hypothetical protein ABH872_07705 [Candidatus Omnitrophota bacterium]